MNKKNGIYQDADMGRFYRILEYLAKTVNEKMNVIYIVGSTYKDISEETKRFDMKIIDIQSLRRGWLKIIPIPVAKRFLIKLTNKKDLVEIVKSLEEHDPIEIFVFDRKIEDKFLKNFDINNREYSRSIIMEDSGYLIYGMDFDNMESTTGALEFISYGDKISSDMKWFF